MSESENRAADGLPAEGGVNPGELLAHAREKAKLSTSDVARQLKLSVGQVEALEAGRFERLPGAVFVRGFIRNYARLVKLDPEHVLAAAGNRLPQHVARPETPPSQNIPFPSAHPGQWRKYAWAVAVVVAALSFYELFVSNQDSVVTTHPVDVPPPPETPATQQKAPQAKVPPDTGKKKSAIAPGLARPEKDTALAQEPAPIAPVNMGRVSENPPQPAPKPELALPKVMPPSQPAHLEPKPADPNPVPVDPNAKQVTLVFEDESWVEIRDGHGKVIHWQLNPAGTRQVVTGSPPLSFVIGNAHGVRLTFDERPVDLGPYTNTDVARMTLR